jgi:hypothetical protein
MKPFTDPQKLQWLIFLTSFAATNEGFYFFKRKELFKKA